ncbi:MAG: 50S ribosomal protein L13 [Candidatus Methanofastidiosa archaeon]|nr:50S ribosomal protein L13 [Candidatus Methanofastidiosa archaeon]
MYIDGDNLILGRMANEVAQMLLAGEPIVIVNAEKIVISGNKEDIFKRFKHRTDLADRANPRRGPFFPKTSDKLVRRTIRGMLPWRKPSGREAFRRLEVYEGIPSKYSNKEFIRIENADGNNLGTHKIVTVAELSQYLRGD